MAITAKCEFTCKNVSFSSTKTVTFGDGKIVKFPSAKGKLVHFRSNETPLWAVTAASFVRKTGQPQGLIRTETIFKNSDGDWLFGDCKTIDQVKERYEAYWNDSNPHSYAMVFVKSVYKYA